MKTEIIECDISNRKHRGKPSSIEIQVIFGHDQEDGKQEMSPYLEEVKIDICPSCMEFILTERRYIYAYGAMGFNKYTL